MRASTQSRYVRAAKQLGRDAGTDSLVWQVPNQIPNNIHQHPDPSPRALFDTCVSLHGASQWPPVNAHRRCLRRHARCRAVPCPCHARRHGRHSSLPANCWAASAPAPREHSAHPDQPQPPQCCSCSPARCNESGKHQQHNHCSAACGGVRVRALSLPPHSAASYSPNITPRVMSLQVLDK
jgi:hypothetical protein